MKTLSLEVLDGKLQSCIKTFKGSFLCGFIKFLEATMKRKSHENVHQVQATMLKSFFDPMDNQLKRAHTPGTSTDIRCVDRRSRQTPRPVYPHLKLRSNVFSHDKASSSNSQEMSAQGYKTSVTKHVKETLVFM